MATMGSASRGDMDELPPGMRATRIRRRGPRAARLPRGARAEPRGPATRCANFLPAGIFPRVFRLTTKRQPRSLIAVGRPVSDPEDAQWPDLAHRHSPRGPRRCGRSVRRVTLGAGAGPRPAPGLAASSAQASPETLRRSVGNLVQAPHRRGAVPVTAGRTPSRTCATSTTPARSRSSMRRPATSGSPACSSAPPCCAGSPAPRADPGHLPAAPRDRHRPALRSRRTAAPPCRDRRTPWPRTT